MSWRDALDWEEGAFRLLLAGWRRVRPAEEPRPPSTALFEEEIERLAVLAQALCGEPLRLRRARGAGGIRGAELLLPATLDLGSYLAENQEAYRVQTVLASKMRQLTRGFRPPPRGTFEAELASLRIAARAAEEVCDELPAFRNAYERVTARVRRQRATLVSTRMPWREAKLERIRLAAMEGRKDWDSPQLETLLVGPRIGKHRSPELPIWGSWLDAEVDAAPDGEVTPNAEGDGGPTSEFAAPPVDTASLVSMDESEAEDPPPSPPFERVETLDRYSGPGRELDGSDELSAHLEALEEVDLDSVFRGGPGAQSILKADMDFGFELPQPNGVETQRSAIRYDEWDGRKNAYRRNWCSVFVSEADPGDATWAREKLAEHRPQIRRLRRGLEASRSGLRPVPRQLEGEEIDLDPAICARIDIQAGCDPDPRVYRRLRKRRRDFVTTVLLDVSMSTDAWVGGRRILDVGRESVLILGQVAHDLGDRLEVLAFASETRNRCQVWDVQRFGEPWSVGRRRLSGLRPTGYTRVGPALRHATASLVSQVAERRLLLLISDAKPTDYDRYEGRYGAADVRKAVEEAERADVQAHALAIDDDAREDLPGLFGRNRWHAMERPDQLPEILAEVYGKLTAS